jgi:PAS domain S-box-containing protein
MKGGQPGGLTSVKGSALRHPAVIAAGAASLGALVVTNAIAFMRGMEAPWLLGAVILTDMLVVGVAIFVAAREVVTAEHQTEVSRGRLRAILDSAMDAIVTVDEAHRIVLFNRAAEQVFGLGREEALGTPLERLIPERFRDAHRRHMEEFGRTGMTARRMGGVAALWGLRADGTEFPIEASISHTAEDGKRFFTVILRDITQRRQAEARLAAIVDSAMDAVITVDAEQSIVLFNRAAESVFGLKREQALGTPLERLLPARFRGAHRAHIEAFGRTGVTSRRMGDVTTLWGLRADGSEFPLEASISQVSEGGKRYFTVILRDISLRKQHEDALRRSQRELRDLSARVLEAREEEKTLIARELHDELGQLLTALKMDLSSLRQGLPGEELQAKADEMGRLLDQTVAATRRISADLRPLMLDDLGLADAAGWLVEDFCKRSGIDCRMETSGAEALAEASKAVATAVYRAIQESLTNIARHSGARNAWVNLSVTERCISVEVEDDGRGITAEAMAKSRSLGLKGMRERIAYLGGSLDIARAPRGGTRLQLRVPLRGLEQETAA